MTKDESTKILRIIYALLKRGIKFKYVIKLAFVGMHMKEFRNWKSEFYRTITDRQALNLFERAEEDE